MDLIIQFTPKAGTLFCPAPQSGQAFAKKVEDVAGLDFAAFRQAPLLDNDYSLETDIPCLGLRLAFSAPLSTHAMSHFNGDPEKMIQFCGALEDALIEDINTSGSTASVAAHEIKVTLSL